MESKDFYLICSNEHYPNCHVKIIFNQQFNIIIKRNLNADWAYYWLIRSFQFNVMHYMKWESKSSRCSIWHALAFLYLSLGIGFSFTLDYYLNRCVILEWMLNCWNLDGKCIVVSSAIHTWYNWKVVWANSSLSISFSHQDKIQWTIWILDEQPAKVSTLWYLSLFINAIWHMLFHFLISHN